MWQKKRKENNCKGYKAILTSRSFGEGRRALRAVVFIGSVAAVIHPVAPNVERHALPRLTFVPFRLSRPIKAIWQGGEIIWWKEMLNGG